MSFQRKLKTQLFENIGSMAYRKGVLLGNFVEDLAVEADPHGKTDNFENVTTNREAFRATGKTGHALMEVSTREDVRLKGDQEVGENTIVRKVQECLWSGKKLIDCNVPKSIKLRGLAEARQRKLADAVAKDTYLTIEKEALQASARDPARATARPQGCKPKAEGGQETQVGRKAVGEFARHLDRDFHRIGLRR